MAAIEFCCDLWWPHTDFVVPFFILSELVPVFGNSDSHLGKLAFISSHQRQLTTT